MQVYKCAVINQGFAYAGKDNECVVSLEGGRTEGGKEGEEGGRGREGGEV